MSLLTAEKGTRKGLMLIFTCCLWLLPISGFDSSSLGTLQVGGWTRNRYRYRSTSLTTTTLNEFKDENLGLKVGIAGAGSIAFATASLLSSLGHNPMVWSPSGGGTKELVHNQEATCGNLLSKIQSTGALDQTFDVRVALSPNELIVSNDNVLVIALPVNGHKQVMETIAPEIVQYMMDEIHKKPAEGTKPIMHIIISSHASLGAVYLMNLLKNDPKNVSGDTDWVKITSWGTTAVTARKLSGSSVKVLTVRQAVDFCTIPSSPSDDPEITMQSDPTSTPKNYNDLLSNGYTLCTCLFGPRFKHRKGGLLAISLSNLNPQNHLGIVLGNMSRMDPPPPPPPVDLETKPPEIPIEPW